MSTATKPLPEHGTPARGNGVHGGRPPCKCEPCVLAIRAVRKRRKVLRQLGRPALIDATPVREHLILLHRTMCWRILTAATGCDDRNLVAIYRGAQAQVTRTTHVKIMAVQPAAEPGQTLYVDATPSRRRIQAMQCIGHSYRAIAEASRSTDTRIHLIADGQPTVRKAVADRIAAAYRQLAYQAPGFDRFTSRTRNNAIAKGWVGPLAWDGNIDDPAAQPDTTGIGATVLPKRDNLRNDEIKHLAGFQLPLHEIAKRVGLEEKDVEGRLTKWRTEREQEAIAS